MKLAILIMLLAVFAMPAVADDVDKWIQDLNDTSSGVREDAARSLRDLNDIRAVEPFIQALDNEDDIVRSNAAESLGNLGDIRAVEPLILALTDEDEYVRGDAAWALGKLKDTRALEPLKSALNDEDEDVRGYAGWSLGELNDTNAKESQSYFDPVPSANSAKAQSPQNEPLNTSGALRLSDTNEVQLYENAQYGFGMSHPINWIVQEPDANDQGIVVGFLAPGEDVNSPATYLLVQIEKLPSGQKITLEQYGQAGQRNLKAAVPDLKILTESDISIGGQPGHAIVYNLASQDVTFRVLKAWTLRGEKAYAFTYNAPDDRYDESAGDISKMIGSLSAA